MEGRRTVWKTAELRVAVGLFTLILACSVTSEGATSESGDSVGAASVSASQARSETAQTSDDTRATGADAAFDGSAGSVLPLADIPIAALFLVGVCVLGAGLGPHTRRRRQAAEQDAMLPESHVGREGRAPN